MIIGKVRLFIGIAAGCLTELDIRIFRGIFLCLYAVSVARCENNITVCVNQLLQGAFHLILRHIEFGNSLHASLICFFYCVLRIDKIVGIAGAGITHVDKSDLDSLPFIPAM